MVFCFQLMWRLMTTWSRTTKISLNLPKTLMVCDCMKLVLKRLCMSDHVCSSLDVTPLSYKYLSTLWLIPQCFSCWLLCSCVFHSTMGNWSCGEICSSCAPYPAVVVNCIQILIWWTLRRILPVYLFHCCVKLDIFGTVIPPLVFYFESGTLILNLSKD